MNNLLSTSLVLLLVSAPVVAQDMGRVNQDAPRCASSITFKDQSTIKVEYIANTWAQGRTFTGAMDKEKGARQRTMINNAGPLGTLTTSADLTVGNQAVPAGDYKLAFKIDDDTKWHLTLIGGSNKIDIPLSITDSTKDSKRISIVLAATENSTGAELSMAFGNRQCSITVSKGAPAKAKDASGEKTDKSDPAKKEGEIKEGAKKDAK